MLMLHQDKEEGLKRLFSLLHKKHCNECIRRGSSSSRGFDRAPLALTSSRGSLTDLARQMTPAAVMRLFSLSQTNRSRVAEEVLDRNVQDDRQHVVQAGLGSAADHTHGADVDVQADG